MIVGVRAAGERSRPSQHKRAASWEGDKRKKAWWALSDNLYHSSACSRNQRDATNRDVSPQLEIEEEISLGTDSITVHMRGATGAPKCGSSLAPKAPLVTQKGEAGEIKAKGATHPPSAHRQVSGLQRYGMESGEDEEYDDLGSGSFDEEGMENAISAFRQSLQGQAPREKMEFDRSTVRWVGNDAVLDEFEAALDGGEDPSMQRLQLSKQGPSHSAFKMTEEEVLALQQATSQGETAAWFREGLSPWEKEQRGDRKSVV